MVFAEAQRELIVKESKNGASTVVVRNNRTL